MSSSPAQDEALRALLGEGIGRATEALSILVDRRLRLTTPEIAIYSLSELGPRLKAILHGEVVTVHQIFSGAMAGDAMFLLELNSASTLISLLTGTPPSLPDRLGRADQDALVEVGNILLNALVGTISNMLKVRVIFTIPYLRLEAVDSMLDTLMIEQDEIRHALLVTTQFRVEDDDVEGYLVLVLGLSSLEHLLTRAAGDEAT